LLFALLFSTPQKHAIPRYQYTPEKPGSTPDARKQTPIPYGLQQPMRDQREDAAKAHKSGVSSAYLTKERSFFTVFSTFVLSKSCHD
jgi:hypothetical protein